MYRNSLYHKTLRVMLVVTAVVLTFDSGVLTPITKQISSETQVYVATVIGVGAAVEPTELNTLTAELTRQRTELTERENEITAREIAVGLRTADGTTAKDNTISTYLISTLLFIILILIVLNYVMDFMRERHLRALALQSRNAG